MWRCRFLDKNSSAKSLTDWSDSRSNLIKSTVSKGNLFTQHHNIPGSHALGKKPFWNIVEKAENPVGFEFHLLLVWGPKGVLTGLKIICNQILKIITQLLV